MQLANFRRTMSVCVIVAFVALAGGTVLGQVITQTPTTVSFESDQAESNATDFSFEGVNFTGGVNLTVGAPPLYSSGFFAYRVESDATVTITFDGVVKSVEAFFVHSAGEPAQMQFLDTEGGVLGTAMSNVPASPASHDQFVSFETDSIIASVVVTAPAGTTAWVDDFSINGGADQPPEAPTPPVLPPGFRMETVADGFSDLVAISKNRETGRFYVIQSLLGVFEQSPVDENGQSVLIRSGALWSFDPATDDANGDGVIQESEATLVVGDIGAPLLGVLVDQETGQVFISHADEIDGVPQGVISRVDEAGGTLIPLITGLNSRGWHQNNGLEMGPDRKIYFGFGSATNKGNKDENLGFGQQFDDLTTGMKPNASILRFDPFAGDAESTLEWVARGFRNPWKPFFDSDGNLFIGVNDPEFLGQLGESDPCDELVHIRLGPGFSIPVETDGRPLFYGFPCSFAIGNELTGEVFGRVGNPLSAMGVPLPNWSCPETEVPYGPVACHISGGAASAIAEYSATGFPALSGKYLLQTLWSSQQVARPDLAPGFDTTDPERGRRVVLISLADDGAGSFRGTVEPFVTNFRGHPIGMMVDDDRSLLVVDQGAFEGDQFNVISGTSAVFRISFDCPTFDDALIALNAVVDRDAPTDGNWSGETEFLDAVRAVATEGTKFIAGCFEADQIAALMDAVVAARATAKPNMDAPDGSSPPQAACGACGTLGLVEFMMFGTGLTFLRVKRRRHANKINRMNNQ